MRSFTCVSVVVYVARKLRPCLSYSRRRDRINLVPNFNSVPNVVQPHKLEVEEHSYYALIYVCVGSCICRAQATPLSKLQ